MTGGTKANESVFISKCGYIPIIAELRHSFHVYHLIQFILCITIERDKLYLKLQISFLYNSIILHGNPAKQDISFSATLI